MNLSAPAACDSQLTSGETPAIPVKIYMVVLCAVAISVAGFVGVRSRQESLVTTSRVGASAVSREDLTDRGLSAAAASALGERQGTIIVMDPRTGRIRAVVNPQIAFEAGLTPGSTIKPFTTLAALRSGKIDKDSRLLCREYFAHQDFKTVCSHPGSLPPLKPEEALSYSCNYFFGKLGEHLRESEFNSTLSEFGFGQPTRINQINVREAAGKLLHGHWHAKTALGEGDQIQVTPIQLLIAYSAMVNGGHLLVPQIAPDTGFVAQYQRDVSIDDRHRKLILDGMRGAVRYGTAERARLHSLPLYVFGKTGTATPTGGFRNHGWFVGFASRSEESPTAPEHTELAVLVFLKRAHGVDAGEAARVIFEAYVREESDAQTVESSGEQSLRLRRFAGQEGWFTPADSPQQASVSKPAFLTCESMQPERLGAAELCQDQRRTVEADSSVRVHLVRENVTQTISLEDYVLGVVAAEGSTEGEVEALKSLAVASRTYALKNLRRHAADGYDLCTTTHCQRYRPRDTRDNGSQISAPISQAVQETTGQVLRDYDGRIVDSYFSASCGGATANISSLWGVKAPSYLIGGNDEYCLTMPHHTWRDVISSADLLRALESDPRTKVGGPLTNVEVTKRDASGRAELITIEGGLRRRVKGWDFKIIVGRALGWNLLKSSRFEITRSRSDYVFRGSGFGHGLGLCQEGAHVMARRGAGYQQILAKYFPGTRVGKEFAGTESQKTGYLAGQEGWFTPTGSHRQTSGGKRPFPTCKFMQPERSNESALLRRQKNQPVSLSPLRSVMSHHTMSPRLPVSPRRLTLSSEHFQLSYPSHLSQRDVEYVLKVLESNRADLIQRTATAGVSSRLTAVEVLINETTGDFVGRTGQSPWAAAATLGKRIELQPFELLSRRRIIETTIRHELVHAVVEEIGQGGTPRWLAEGLALHLAGEGRLISRYQRNTQMGISELEQRLSRPANAADMRASYAAAYQEVRRLIQSEGESSVWRRITRLRN